MIKLVGHAECLTCEWREDGPPATTDKAAEKHTKKEGHPTLSESRPAKKGEHDGQYQ